VPLVLHAKFTIILQFARALHSTLEIHSTDATKWRRSKLLHNLRTHVYLLLVDNLLSAKKSTDLLHALVSKVTLDPHQIADQNVPSTKSVQMTRLVCNKSVKILVQDLVDIIATVELPTTTHNVIANQDLLEIRSVGATRSEWNLLIPQQKSSTLVHHLLVALTLAVKKEMELERVLVLRSTSETHT